MNYINKLEKKIKKELEKYKPLLILTSGGADSTLLSEVAYKNISLKNFQLLHAKLPFSPISETKSIIEFASTRGIKLHIIEPDLLEINEIMENSPERCYHCKKQIISSTLKYLKNTKTVNIVDGTVCDDFTDYRPGLKATDEFAIKHPLASCGFSKKEVRLLSRYYNLRNWNLPASACLASRIPTNQRINVNDLKIISNAENYLTDLGFKGCRVRCFPNQIAYIEVFPIYLSRLYRLINSIEKKLKSMGFTQVNISKNGYKKGAMNLGNK